ncbi:GNAT family N-acetyltransferase [Sphingomonas lacunae]|uniref:GNAT family N-acetyltransferase n=2 Tax=Sphingomonas lacunae TaxID=2698828 RepID=A0A6M4B2G5_9SPHN|nr:GNAT family N-acetyltransferase [Sphingomonas lacunae]
MVGALGRDSREQRDGDKVVIETPRLILREWRDEDSAPFKFHLNTPTVMRWLGGIQSDAEFDAFVARNRACAASHGHCFWIAERKSDRAILGFCGLKRVNSDGASNVGDHEIGWRLREDAQGLGYAREAAEATLSAAFHRFGAPHVVAFTVAENAASWGLMQRLGMVRARDLDFTGGFAGGGSEHIIVYRIDKEDWTT